MIGIGYKIADVAKAAMQKNRKFGDLNRLIFILFNRKKKNVLRSLVQPITVGCIYSLT